MSKFRWTGSRKIAAVCAVFSVLIGLLTNIATGSLPTWVQPYTPFSWGILIPLICMFIYISAKTAPSQTSTDEVDPERLNYYIEEVRCAEEAIGKYSELNTASRWEDELTRWKNITITIMTQLGVITGETITENWELRSTSSQYRLLAELALRLTKAVIIPLTHQGQWHTIIFIAKGAFEINKACRYWEEAANMAYIIAHVSYEYQLNYILAHAWAGKMKGILDKQTIPQPSSDDLRSKYLDMQGLLFRDMNNKFSDARNCFHRALAHSNKVTSSVMRWRIKIHLGTLEKREGHLYPTMRVRHLEEAEKLYQEALQEARQLKDPVPRLECYQILGDLAVAQRDFETAIEWYKILLNETEPWQIVYQGRAYRGLAEALIQRIPPDIENAFLNAIKALDIEQKTSESKANETRILIVSIATRLYEKYCATPL